MKAFSDWSLVLWASLAGCIIGWELLKMVIVKALMLATEPKQATEKQGLLGEDFF